MTHRDPAPDLDSLLKEVDSLRALARGLLRDEHDVDDVLQETRLRAWRRPPASPRPWLARVVRNLALNRLRGAHRRASHERATSGVAAPPGPDEIAARMETQRRLAQAVADLAEPYRTTIFLRFFQDLTPSEISGRLGEPAGTVRSRLKRGLDLLRTRLDADHGDDRRASRLALVALAGVRNVETSLAPFVLALGVAGLAAAVGLVLAVESGDAPPLRLEASSAGATEEAQPAPPDSPAPAVRTTRILAGRVEAAWGAPIPGATVVVAEARGRRSRATMPVATVTAGADASFRFEVEEGEYRVLAHAEGFAWAETDPFARTHGIVLRLFPSRRLSGVVVDEALVPVAGARLLGPGPGDEVSTGPDGTFDVEAGPEGVALWVEHPRFVPTWASERYAPWRVVLGAPQVLSGVVVDTDGKPVAGAEVTVWARTTYDVRTDASGRFRIDGFGAGRAGETDEEGPPVFWMRVDARERGWRFLELVWTPGHELRLVLGAVRTLRARVTEQGRPVAGLALGLRVDVVSRSSLPGDRPIAEGVTDIEGRVSFTTSRPPHLRLDLPGDEYVFAPRSTDYVPSDAEEIDVPILRRPWARGRVAGPDGRPIAGATIWTQVPKRREKGPPRGAASTDDAGRFRLPLGLATDGLVVAAAHDGYETVMSEPFVPEAGTERELEVRLLPLDGRCDIVGIVVTEDGVPAAMTRIFARSPELRDAGETYSALDGTFRIRGLKEGAYQVNATVAPGKGVDTVASTGVPIRIVLQKPPPPAPPDIEPKPAPEEERWTAITGRVLDMAGQPYPYDSVPAIFWKAEAASTGRARWGKARCDLEGRFRIRVPDQGTFRLEVQHIWPPMFRPLEGVHAGTRDLVLQPAKSGAITGRIRLRDGSALRWPRVYAVPRDKVGADGRPRTSDGNWSGEGATDLDKEGRFRIHGLLGDRYVIVAHDESHAVAFRLAAVGDDVEVVLEPGLPIAGKVVGTDGNPAAKCLVRAEDSLGVHRQTWTDLDGRFEFTGLPEGACRVHAMADGHLLALVEAAEPGTKELVLALRQYEAEEFFRLTDASRKR